MDHRYYLTCLWPGLSELWWRGRLSALPLAIGFAIGLNALLTLRFLLPSWLDPVLVRLACWIGLAIWMYWVVKGIRELPALLDPRAVTEHPDVFPEAQSAYLRGNWVDAERLLLETLSVEPRDPPALLLLAGVYRHTDRLPHAQSLIEEIRRLEVADGWQIEIDAEVGRLARAIDRSQEDDDASGAGAADEDDETVADATGRGAGTAGGAADLTAA
jgi:hypothetical protein